MDMDMDMNMNMNMHVHACACAAPRDSRSSCRSRSGTGARPGGTRPRPAVRATWLGLGLGLGVRARVRDSVSVRGWGHPRPTPPHTAFLRGVLPESRGVVERCVQWCGSQKRLRPAMHWRGSQKLRPYTGACHGYALGHTHTHSHSHSHTLAIALAPGPKGYQSQGGAPRCSQPGSDGSAIGRFQSTSHRLRKTAAYAAPPRAFGRMR
eukprot:scaffold74736_cov51-Phaeocystis_antarctica.AAC.1